MSKGKNFREWIEEDYTKEKSEKNKGSKQYDGKKSEIQRARRQKRTQKESLYK